VSSDLYIRFKTRVIVLFMLRFPPSLPDGPPTPLLSGGASTVAGRSLVCAMYASFLETLFGRKAEGSQVWRGTVGPVRDPMTQSPSTPMTQPKKIVADSKSLWIV
jgi:hypothetical protein